MPAAASQSSPTDEVPPEPPEGHEEAHAATTCPRRTEVPDESRFDQATTKRSTPTSAASPPGQCAPAPSADQKIPNVVSMTPTANFIVFSGTRERRPCEHTNDRDQRHCGLLPRRPAGSTPACSAERQDDERHLEPLQEHALEREGEAVPIEPGALVTRSGFGLRSSSREDRVLVVQRLEAARAQDRLAQPLEAEDEQQRADDESQGRSSGTSVRAGPSDATTTASASAAAANPGE